MNKLPHKISMEIYQGTTYTRKVTWIDRETNLPAVDFTLFDARLILRSNNGKQSIILNSNGGGLVINETEGSITVALTSAQTNQLRPSDGTLWGRYELELHPKVGSDPVYTLIYGDVILTEKV